MALMCGTPTTGPGNVGPGGPGNAWNAINEHAPWLITGGGGSNPVIVTDPSEVTEKTL
ncbi:MAG: hypothetical protein KAT70_03225 [Thermoplasmata archaeon]|nr:hypothetical protein [Thermoplasmata archaeon]